MDYYEFITDKELFFGQKAFDFPLPDSFETVFHCFQALKKHRDSVRLASTESHYMQEFFRTLGFHPEQKAPRLLALHDPGAKQAAKALVLLVYPGENLEEIAPDLDWVSYLFYAAHYYQAPWGILTNGSDMKFFDFQRDTYRETYLSANLDGIFAQIRLESFFVVYKVFAALHSQTLDMPPVVIKKQTDDQEDEPARYALRREFWGQLLEKAKKKTSLHANISPGKDHWITASAGSSGLGFSYVVRMKDAQVELFIDKGNKEINKQIFNKIYAEKNRVELRFGSPLDWQRLDDGQGSRIRYLLPEWGLSDQEHWSELQEKMIAVMIRFEKALRPELGGQPAIITSPLEELEETNSLIKFPLPVRGTRKGQTYEGELLDLKGTVRWNGQDFPTPTSAAKATDSTIREVNGWDFWRYFDAQSGEWRGIGELRTKN